MDSAPLQADPKPEPPIQPTLEDCCTSGCVYCVFDMYEEKLEKYKIALAEWDARQAGTQSGAQCEVR